MAFYEDKNVYVLNTKSQGEVVVPIDKAFFERFDYNNSNLEQLIVEDQKDYYQNLTFNEYIYIFFSVYKQSEYLSDTEKEKIDGIEEQYALDVAYIDDINFAITESKDRKPAEFDINPLLLAELHKNMNPNYDTSERIYYYYFKLCILLELDIDYCFCSLISKYDNQSNYCKSANRLGNINSENNSACCFEFDAILDKLIKMEGEVTKCNTFFGGSSHVYTEAIIDRKYHFFDAFKNIGPNFVSGIDFVNVKLGKNYNGIIDDVIAEANGVLSFNEKIYNVYCDVQREFSDRFNKKKFNKDDLDYCFSIIDKLNVKDIYKDKLKSYFSEFNKIPYSGATYFKAILDSGIIDDDDKDKINLTGVCSNKDSCGLSFILSVLQDNGEFIYFVFGDNYGINVLNKDEITNAISDLELIVCKKDNCFRNPQGQLVVEPNYRLIPGIDPHFQRSMNGVAREELLPKVFKRVYAESYGSGDGAKIKNKA